MWLKSERESKVKSFLTKVFPFLKRNRTWKHSRLGKGEDINGSKWSFISTTTADAAEFDESDLLGSIPNNNNASCHGYVDWLPLTGSEKVKNQNVRREKGPKKNVKKFKLKILFRKRKRPSSDMSHSVAKVDKRLVDGVNEEASDNRVNEEITRQMAISSEQARLVEKDEARTWKRGNRNTTGHSQNEAEKRTTKSKDRIKRKRRRKDNYVAIEDENGNGLEMATAEKCEDVPCTRLVEDCQDQSGQHKWNADFSRQLSDGVWCQDTTAACRRSTEARHQKSAQNKRKRSFNIKASNGKKKLARNRYEKMQSSVDHLDVITGTKSRQSQHRSKQVKGGTWKMCKSGWKIMKSGLIYYSKTPVTNAGFNPVLRRYEDGFKEFKDMEID